MALIVLLTGNHLCHNPRVIKEATTLAQAGYEVEVLGAWLDEGLKAKDEAMLDDIPFRFTPVLDLTNRDWRTMLHRQICRVRTKLGNLAYQWGGLSNGWQFGYAVLALRRAAISRRANLYVAHSEVGMWVAVDLFKRGRGGNKIMTPTPHPNGNAVELSEPVPSPLEGGLGWGREIGGQDFDFTPLTPTPLPEGEGLLALTSTALRLRGGRSEGSEATDLSRPPPNPPPLGEGTGRLNLATLTSLKKLKKPKNLNIRVGVDMEDWFSEDLLPEARRGRPIGLLRSLEQQLLLYGVHATCPSQVMADALAKEYGCTPPHVVYNAFPWSDRDTLDGCLKDRRNFKVPSLHWFSQAVGHGRGLEDLFAALPKLKYPMEIHLRGKKVADFDVWLAKCVPEGWQDKVFVHDLVSNEELLSRIAEHDIGFAGEMKYCRSRDLTVTNKILHYLLGGLAVVASDTTGQREIAEQALDAVLIYPSGNPEALAARLNLLLESKENLAQAKQAALDAAERIFCWECQAEGLLASVASALEYRQSATL